MKIQKIFLPIVSAALLLVFSACGDSSDIIQPQIERIVRYIEQVDNQRNPNNEDIPYTIQDGVYRYYYGSTLGENEDPTRLGTVQKGSEVELFFAIYTFTSAPSATPIYSNMTFTDFEHPWGTDPLSLKIGDGAVMMSKVENALVGFLEKDRILLFLPSDQAYGNKVNGAVPPNTAIMYDIVISKVN